LEALFLSHGNRTPALHRSAQQQRPRDHERLKNQEAMQAKIEDNTYNTELFSRGLRRWIHLARFRWLGDILRRYEHTPRRVVELGCFDAKSIDYLPQQPDFYLGLDANWGGGLDLGRDRWKGTPFVQLACCTAPGDLPTGMAPFDTVISMETLEHLPSREVELYLDGLAAIARGIVLITVPNEIGLVFAFKWLFKAALRRNTYAYSFREWLAATLGKTDRIKRNQHKGFDYRRLVDSVARRFEILEVTPLPVRWLPVRLGVTIGVVAQSRQLSGVPLPHQAERSAERSGHRAAA
jgi:hypothetical protein